MRALRLGVADAKVSLAAATSVRDILAGLEQVEGPAIAVIDSIQTMYVDTLDSAPGTVAQVRASAQELIRLAKRKGLTVILVGHVTKEGLIAGPRVLEHMVDTVLYFEGERGHQFRILRAVKNRFGPTDEIGVFEMGELVLRGAESLGPVPGGTQRRGSRRGGVRGHRGHAAALGRDPGPVRALAHGHAPPRGRGLGFRPSGAGFGGFGGARRACLRGQ